MPAFLFNGTCDLAAAALPCPSSATPTAAFPSMIYPAAGHPCSQMAVVVTLSAAAASVYRLTCCCLRPALHTLRPSGRRHQRSLRLREPASFPCLQHKESPSWCVKECVRVSVRVSKCIYVYGGWGRWIGL